MFNNSPTLKILCILAILSLTFSYPTMYRNFIKFGYNLYHNIAEEIYENNILISPICVSLGIGMLYKGAQGETATELEHTISVERLLFIDYNYEILLWSIENIPGVTVAYKVYISDKFQVQDNYTHELKTIFSSSIESVDFSRAQETADSINEWLKTKSNNLISKLVEPNKLSGDTGLLLLNTITFNAELKSPFNAANTRQEFFHQEEAAKGLIPMMFQTGNFVTQYHKDLKSTSLILPYKTDGLSLVIFFPDAFRDISILERRRKYIKLSDLKTGAEFESRVDVYLPRLKVECEYDLKKYLEYMGLRKSFSKSANYSGIAESSDTPLSVSKFIHKTVFIIDEKGSTPESGSELGTANGTESFLANRPFIFFVKGTFNDVILSGTYRGPLVI